jgi:hypothetical protein
MSTTFNTSQYTGDKFDAPDAASEPGTKGWRTPPLMREIGSLLGLTDAARLQLPRVPRSG